MTKDIGAPFSKEDAVNAFRALGVQTGDILLVQSGFRNFRAINGGPHALITALLEAVGDQGTLIMPSFNMTDFGKNKYYSKKNTRPETGLLCELFFDWVGCRHIYHPLHGFSLVGKDAAAFSKKIKNQTSFEKASLWGELHRLNGKIMLLGVSYRDGFSFFHYLEESIGVPYRKFLTLTGKVEELDGTIHEIALPYYGRASMSISYDIDKVLPFLEGADDSIVKKIKLGTGVVRLMDARQAYDRLAEVLRKNPNLVLIDQ